MHGQQNINNIPDNINGYEPVLEQDHYHVNLVSQHCGFCVVNIVCSRILIF